MDFNKIDAYYLNQYSEQTILFNGTKLDSSANDDVPLIVDYILNKEKCLYEDRKTGLPNDLKFLKDCDKYDDRVIFILKIDKFSEINRLYGREGGDIIIKEIIKRFQEEFEGKYGLRLHKLSGLYFGLMSESCGSLECSEQLQQNITNFLNNFYIDTDVGRLKIYLNMGGANSGKGSFDKALVSLYMSGDNGGLCMYTDELGKQSEEEILNNILWIEKINSGIEESRFFPVFQGIRDNRTGETIKYETLMRYRDNSGNIISPYEGSFGGFLSIAEKINKITDLTEIMIDKLIEKMKDNSYSFSINFTEECLLNDNLIDFLIDKVVENGISPSRIIIEILEDIVDEDGVIINRIKQLKDVGLKIAVDDFGSGYSSIERLFEIEPNFAKIDGSLIRNIYSDKRKLKTVKAIYNLAKTLGTEVIAEFVEDEETQKVLDVIGIEYSQGYLFSKPSEKLIGEE